MVYFDDELFDLLARIVDAGAGGLTWKEIAGDVDKPYLQSCLRQMCMDQFVTVYYKQSPFPVTDTKVEPRDHDFQYVALSRGIGLIQRDRAKAQQAKEQAEALSKQLTMQTEQIQEQAKHNRITRILSIVAIVFSLLGTVLGVLLTHELNQRDQHTDNHRNLSNGQHDLTSLETFETPIYPPAP